MFRHPGRGGAIVILLFESVHLVMRAERALKRASVPHELAPTPKEHSADCGMCIRAADAHLGAAREALRGIAFREAGETGGGPAA